MHRQANLSPGQRVLWELRARRAVMYESPTVGLSSHYLASPGYRILRELRARRVWALANEPAGSGFEPAIPDVFQQDLSKMHPDMLRQHSSGLSPEQRGVVLRKLKSDQAAARNAVVAVPGTPAAPAYSPEHEESVDRTKQQSEADYAKRQSERQHLEALFSDHFNEAIGKATTPSGRQAVIGDRPPRNFTAILSSLIPKVYHEVAAAHGVQDPYDATHSHRDMMAIGAEMMNPRQASFRLQHYDPHRPGPHRGLTYGAYFGTLARKIAQEHFSSRLKRAAG
jgi:hypothetical protein